MEFLSPSHRNFSWWNVPGSEELGETGVFAGYRQDGCLEGEQIWSWSTSYRPQALELFSGVDTGMIYQLHVNQKFHIISCSFLQSMFIFLHYLKGTPFQTADQGKARRLTHWEQLNHGEQFTETRKFFTLVPIFL